MCTTKYYLTEVIKTPFIHKFKSINRTTVLQIIWKIIPQPRSLVSKTLSVLVRRVTELPLAGEFLQIGHCSCQGCQ